MTPAEIRSHIVRLVADYATAKKREPAFCWTCLYKNFSYDRNYAFTKIANNSGQKVIDVIEEEGFLEDFLRYADLKLKVTTPTSSEPKKEAPVQGNLLQAGGMP